MDDHRFDKHLSDESTGALDAFSEEHPTIVPRGGDGLIKIVITDDRLTSPSEIFPSEAAYPEVEAVLEEAFLQGHCGFEPAPRPVETPSRVRHAGGRSTLAAGTIVALLGLLAIGRVATMNPSEVSRRSVDVPARVPAATADVNEAAPLASPAAAAVPNHGDVATVDTVSRSRIDRTASLAIPEARDRTPRGEVAAGIRSVPAGPAESPLAETSVATLPPPPPAVATPSSLPSPPAALLPGAQPVNSAPAVREEPASPPATLPPAAAASGVVAQPLPAPDTGAVAQALNRYQQAFSALDANAARDVWPSVDVKALGRAFDQLEEQTVDLQSCDIGIAGARAEAACTGTASYVRKVGNKSVRQQPRQWRFTLRQENKEWLIDKVDVR